jgi:hypothetical protein
MFQQEISSSPASVSTSTIINTLCDFVVARYKDEESNFFLLSSSSASPTFADLNEKATTASQVSAALFKIHTSRICEMRLQKSKSKLLLSSSSSSSTTSQENLLSSSPIPNSTSEKAVLLKEKENTKTFNPYSVALLTPSVLFPEFSNLMERVPCFFVSSSSNILQQQHQQKQESKTEIISAVEFSKSLLHSTMLGSFVTPSMIYANFATWCMFLSPSASAGGGEFVISKHFNGIESAAATATSTSSNSSSSSSGITQQQKISKISLILFALEASQILCETLILSSKSHHQTTLFSNRLSIQQSLNDSNNSNRQKNENEGNEENLSVGEYCEELKRLTKSIVQLAVRLQQQIQVAVQNQQKSSKNVDIPLSSESPITSTPTTTTITSSTSTPSKQHKKSLSLSFFSLGGGSSNQKKSENQNSTNSLQSQPLGFFRGNPLTVQEFDDQDSSQILSMMSDSFCRTSFVLGKIQKDYENFVLKKQSTSALTDAVNELGFVLNLYCLAPTAKQLVQIQNETMKTVKMSHLW